jgi:uncharacterized protein YjbI with pentapeptide repeats
MSTRSTCFLVLLVVIGCQDVESAANSEARQALCRKAISNHDYREKDLKGCFFPMMRIDNADFTGARLDGATFEHTSLRNAIFAGASLDDVSATGADFSGADFTRASMRRFYSGGCKFIGADLSRAVLDAGLFTGTQLESAILRDASMRTMKLVDVSLTGAVMDRVNLEGTVSEGTLSPASKEGVICPTGEPERTDGPDLCIEQRIHPRMSGPPKKSKRRKRSRGAALGQDN